MIFPNGARYTNFIANGFPVGLATSRANVHDSKGAIKLTVDTICNYPTIKLFQADNGYRPGQSSCIRVRLFQSQCNRIAPLLREHICVTLDRPNVNKYWGTGSNGFYDGGP